MKVRLLSYILIVILHVSCDLSNPITEKIVQAPIELDLNSDENVELGRKLFFDKRLSSDGEVSCGTCHIPEFAFTDQKQFSDGVNGHNSLRNAPSILNSTFLKRIMFDAEIKTLEEQILVPLLDTNEMGMKMNELIDLLKLVPEYSSAAKSIYNREFDAFVLTRSIAAYERSLISMNSRHDQAERGEIDRTSEEERGWRLFSEELYCTKCHPAPNFTNFTADNNGLYDDYSIDNGRFRINFDSTEIGFFKIPSLRNVQLTAPYMHDGSLKTLDEVLDHYCSGGSVHVNKSADIQIITLTEKDRYDLKMFLLSLTDTTYMNTIRN